MSNMLHCLELKINFHIVFQTHHTLGICSQNYSLELQNSSKFFKNLTLTTPKSN